MKKREPIRKKDNVVYFPELEKRLAEKGFESLEARKYKEAISFLEDAKNLDQENEDILIGLVLAYFEAAAFNKAKELAKELLQKGVGDYFQMVDLYITILTELHDYNEIVTILEVLLEEKDIPLEQKQHFLSILKFSTQMAENHHEMNRDIQEEELPIDEGRKKLELFSLTDPNKQLLLVSELTNKNIRPFLQEIKEYLHSESGHPFFKSMLLNLLKDQEYDSKVLVHKFKLEHHFIPVELPEISGQPRMKEMLDILKEKLENMDPILFENVKSLVERHFLITYPFILEPLNTNVWAAAFHYIALEYYGAGPSINDFLKGYSASVKEFKAAIALIREVEEISYPII